MRVWNKNLIVMLCLALAASFGCSRKSGSDTKIQLSFGNGAHNKVGAQSFDATTIEVIILNVTGPGIDQPVYWQWSNHGKPGATPPATISLQVNKGDSRLIQALVVLKQSAGAAMPYLYADSLVSLKDDTSSVSLTVAPMGSIAAGDAQISGRYLDTASSGPTGKIGMYFVLPGKPHMLIDSSDIINGWFSVFAIEGGAFEYRLDNGQSLFPVSAVSIDSPELLTIGSDSAQTMRVRTPIYYQEKNGGTARELRQPSRMVFGWFGPGASGKKVCYSNLTGSVPYAFSAATGAGTVTWNPDVTTPAATDAYVEAANSGARGGVSTSNVDTDGICQISTKTRFVDYLSVGSAAITSHDRALGFQGPFQVTQTSFGGNTVSRTLAGSNLTVSWNYLPGVYSSTTEMRIDGADVFARIEPVAGSFNEDYRQMDGVACDQLTNLGFEFLTNKVVNTNSSILADSVTKTVSSAFVTAYSAGNVTTIVCPYSADGAGSKRYFSAAGISWPSGGGSGGGGMGGPATKVGFQGNLLTNSGSCVQADLTLLNAAGFASDPALNTAGVSVTFSGGAVSFKSGGCAGGTLTSPATIPIGQNHITVGLSAGSPGTSTLTSAAASLTSGSDTLTVVGTSAITRVNFTDSSGAPIPALGFTDCKAMKLMFFNSSSSATAYANTTFPLSGSPGVGYYSESSCSTAISSVAVASGASVSPVFYVKASQLGPANLSTLVASYFDNPYTYALSANFAVPVVAAGVPVAFKLVFSPAPAINVCFQANVQLVDYAGTPVNAASALNPINVGLQNFASIIYGDAACTVGPGSGAALSISSGASTSPPVWIKSSTSTTNAINANYSGSGATPNYSGSGQFSF